MTTTLSGFDASASLAGIGAVLAFISAIGIGVFMDSSEPVPRVLKIGVAVGVAFALPLLARLLILSVLS